MANMLIIQTLPHLLEHALALPRREPHRTLGHPLQFPPTPGVGHDACREVLAEARRFSKANKAFLPVRRTHTLPCQDLDCPLAAASRRCRNSLRADGQNVQDKIQTVRDPNLPLEVPKAHLDG